MRLQVEHHRQPRLGQSSSPADGADVPPDVLGVPAGGSLLGALLFELVGGEVVGGHLPELFFPGSDLLMRPRPLALATARVSRSSSRLPLFVRGSSVQ